MEDLRQPRPESQLLGQRAGRAGGHGGGPHGLRPVHLRPQRLGGHREAGRQEDHGLQDGQKGKVDEVKYNSIVYKL